jgi:hypothetical protein
LDDISCQKSEIAAGFLAQRLVLARGVMGVRCRASDPATPSFHL